MPQFYCQIVPTSCKSTSGHPQGVLLRGEGKGEKRRGWEDERDERRGLVEREGRGHPTFQHLSRSLTPRDVAASLGFL